MKSFLELEGLHVFVTGAAGGIGSAIVEEFLGTYNDFNQLSQQLFNIYYHLLLHSTCSTRPCRGSVRLGKYILLPVNPFCVPHPPNIDNMHNHLLPKILTFPQPKAAKSQPTTSSLSINQIHLLSTIYKAISPLNPQSLPP